MIKIDLYNFELYRFKVDAVYFSMMYRLRWYCWAFLRCDLSRAYLCFS